MSRHYDSRVISLIRHWVKFWGQSQSTTLGSMCVAYIRYNTLECCRLTSAARRYQVINTAAMASTPGENLGTAQQILQLKNQRGHQPRQGEMPACPALLKPRSDTPQNCALNDVAGWRCHQILGVDQAFFILLSPYSKFLCESFCGLDLGLYFYLPPHRWTFGGILLCIL